jgi:IclR family mhp operon transcriptional activator
MVTSNPVQPVVRTLQVLEALNRKPASGLADLQHATGLPKPTLVRLLDTLIAAGYATRISSREGYRITGQVLALSSGLRFIDRLVDAAAPAMTQFTREHAWPVGLAKVREGAVVLLHSTGPQSPVLFERVGYNKTYQIMHTAVGQAYMAYCLPEERRRLISAVFPDADLGLLGMRDAKSIEAHLAAVRRRGYAVPISPRPLRMIGIAIPLRQRRHVFGALVMRFPGSVMSAEQAAERYLGALNATGRAIVKALDAQEREP